MLPHVTQRRRQPLLMAALAVVAGTLVAVLAWGIYNSMGRRAGAAQGKTGDESPGLLAEHKLQSQQLRSARAEVTRLRAQLAYIKQTETIDGEACQAVRNTLNVLENESAKLREQLAFYKGIVDPKQARAGVRVQDLQLRRQGDHLHMELVLIQSVREESRIAGTAVVTIEGVNKLINGTPAQTLELKQLVIAGDKDLIFSFKYYEEFSSDFKLPEGFEPAKIVISLKAVNDRPVATDEYQWATLLGAPETSLE